ncbi:siderophore-iron reductase FhuF [Acerihabitans arboris]|uniref:Siderophore-iron reductase FhuF n=1 Tax=Acerihabitans arboris TaxID=2691583 RepID=A0A845SJM2_9GAMM|nr:siderophore-iron reductase FhuF [Acerihabitans arboris]NDL65120.1 siderophore-iron reductase FhuF [Acerihabitans arboris]
MMPAAALPTAECADDIAGSFLFSVPRGGVAFCAADLCMPETALVVIEPFLRLNEGGDRAAVISMWSQWYFALLVAPWTRIALLHGWRLPVDPRDIRLTQSESAVPEKFILADRGSKIAAPGDTFALFRQLVDTHLLPVCVAFAHLSGIKPGLFWNNAAIRVAHGIGMAGEQGADTGEARAFLDTKTLADGTPNRLYQPVRLVGHDVGPKIIRRLCCLRYKLSGLEYCPSCPLLVADERKVRHRERQG